MKITLLIIISSLMFSSCCTTKGNLKKAGQLNMSVDIHEAYGWINMMPGTSEPAVHFTAKVSVTNNDADPVGLKSIELISDRVRINLVDLSVSDSTIQPGESRVLSIKASRELYNNQLAQEGVSVFFYFFSGTKIHRFEINNFKIERVY